jgi:hypothetical protein
MSTPYDATDDRIGRALNSTDIQLVTDRVDALQTVPSEHKQRLIKIHAGITRELRVLM